MKLTGLLVLISGCLFWTVAVPHIELVLAQDSIDLLEIDPLDDDAEVHGNVTVDEDTVFENVQIHYRGAWYLYSLVKNDYKQRNWKVKFARENKYRNRREWNYNYEPHLRQKVCYDIFNTAGVAVPSARHVELFVNGESFGPYLEYEDPDDKQWLLDKFGDNSGDIYKASYDKPNEQSYFALLTDIGDSSSSYYMHYDKKTNEDGDDSLDYRSLVSFIKMINHTPDSEFPDSIRRCFEVESFLKYLVIVNFTLNWDSYPTRPKNFWLYDNPSSGKWTFIPWDLDLTFQRKKTGDVILDTNLSVFYQLDEYEPFDGQENEGTERPLVRRMMKLGSFRDDYIREYRRAMNTYLQIDSLFSDIDSASAVVESILQGDERDKYLKGVNALKAFIHFRTISVTGQLADLSVKSDNRHRTTSGKQLFSVGNKNGSVLLRMKEVPAGPFTVSIRDLLGRQLFIHTENSTRQPSNNTITAFPRLSPGMYLINGEAGLFTYTEKIIIQ